ncbi:MAG TPA: DUF2127 domain-containing protein, partial [Candidatus Saccharimonadales bacterium]|nr:DUF2127 domain-containing protein [Candidatus Saccharimonadales bacterium]
MTKPGSKKIDYNPAEHPRDLTDRAFRISLWGKFIDGLLETAGGILLLAISPDQINHLARWLTEGELSENPHDWVANHILNTAHHLTGASLAFGAAYLLSHGLVKIVLVVEVIRDHLWAYKGLIGVTALFVVYQTYRMVVKFSVSMLLLTLFDLLIIYLTQKEYRRQLAV